MANSFYWTFHETSFQVSWSQPIHLNCKLFVACGHSKYHLRVFLFQGWRSGAFTGKRGKIVMLQKHDSCASKHLKENIIHMGKKKKPEKIIRQ